ncbi:MULTISPECIES: hypothetical protein [Brevibacillus]|uniref:hypothetical protein n=1 Tax=Brevibacillus TaxID=55080 RepID=UPI000EC8081B|nr:hypothetical protein [Brevibacillus sp.]HBZ79059.1 hypothetical protein [Brevibacillus sp.]
MEGIATEKQKAAINKLLSKKLKKLIVNIDQLSKEQAKSLIYRLTQNYDVKEFAIEMNNDEKDNHSEHVYGATDCIEYLSCLRKGYFKFDEEFFQKCCNYYNVKDTANNEYCIKEMAYNSKGNQFPIFYYSHAWIRFLEKELTSNSSLFNQIHSYYREGIDYLCFKDEDEFKKIMRLTGFSEDIRKPYIYNGHHPCKIVGYKVYKDRITHVVIELEKDIKRIVAEYFYGLLK